MANAHMVGPFHRKYGVACALASDNSAVVILLEDGAGAGYTGAVAAGDVKVSKDGAAEANIATLPTSIAGGQWYFVFSAAELQCRALGVRVTKAGIALTQFTVETVLALGKLTVDPTALGSNHNAIEAIGVGTGHGFSGTAGGSGKICNFLDTLEGAEPVAAIAANASAMTILQHVKRREMNKVISTSALMTIFRDDNVTVLETMVVGDDGTTASKGRAS